MDELITSENIEAVKKELSIVENEGCETIAGIIKKLLPQ